MKHPLCQNLREYPIYKVRIWSTPTDSALYVFVGKSASAHKALLKRAAKDDLERVFGKNAAARLGLSEKADVHFVYETIYHDDSVATVKRKLCTYIADAMADTVDPAHVTCWYKTHIRNLDLWAIHTADSIFKNDVMSIDPDTLVHLYTMLLGGTGIHGSALKEVRAAHDRARFMQAIRRHAPKTVYEALGHTFTVDDAAYRYIYPCNPMLGVDYEALPHPQQSAAELHVQESTTLLEMLDLYKNTIHVTTHAHLVAFWKHKDTLPQALALYFPNMTQRVEPVAASVVKAQDEIIHHVHQDMQSQQQQQDAAFTTSLCGIHYLHIRVSAAGAATATAAMEDSDAQVHRLFTRIHADAILPFIHMITAAGQSFLKVHADSFKTREQQRLCAEWIASTKKHMYNSMSSIVLFKLQDHIQVIYTSHGTCDIKYTYRAVDKATPESIQTTFPTIQKAILRHIPELKDVKGLDSHLWQRSLQDSAVKIVRLVTNSRILPKDKSASLQSIRTVCECLSPFFHVIGIFNDVLHLQYRRALSISLQEQMDSFLQSNYRLDREEAIGKLQTLFQLALPKARDVYANWLERRQKGHVFIRPSFFSKAVHVRIRSIKNADYHVLVDGITYLKQEQRLNGLMKLVLLAAQATKAAAAKKAFSFLSQCKSSRDAAAADDLPVFAASPVLSNSSFGDDALGDEIDDATFADVFEDAPAPANANANANAAPANANTNADASNKYSLLRDLKMADPVLFDSKSKGERGWSSQCGHVNDRQPVVITTDDKKRIDAMTGPESYGTGIVSYGSTPALAKKNMYICPDVWCPKTKVSMSYSQYKQNKSACVDAIVFVENEYWGNKKQRFPGFLEKTKHPSKKLCMPCCFKTKNKRVNECPVEKDEDADADANAHVSEAPAPAEAAAQDNNRYVKSDIPVGLNRFGTLPKPLYAFFGPMVCGNRPDGTGHLLGKVNCFVRKGVDHTQSFLSAVAAIVFPDKTATDLLQLLAATITPDVYIQLNMGVTMKYFIDETRDIHDEKHFREFKAWFLSQNKYIAALSLEHVRIEVSAMAQWDAGSPLYKDILREFLIHGSYMQFMAYLSDDGVQKTHDILLDAIKHIVELNLLVFDMDEHDHVWMTCPIFKHKDDLVKKGRPFAFILSKNGFYEPLQHVTVEKGKLRVQATFDKRQMHAVRHVTRAFKSACRERAAMLAPKIAATLANRKQASILFKVIDYDMQLIGFLLKQHVWLPLPAPESVRSVADLDVPMLYAHTLASILRPTHKDIPGFLKELTELLDAPADAFRVESIAEDDQTLLLSNGRVIPTRNAASSREKVMASLSDVIDDHHLWIGWEGADARTTAMNNVTLKEEQYAIFKRQVLNVFQHKPSVSKELAFLWHPMNPFPAKVKQAEIAKRIRETMQTLVIQSALAAKSSAAHRLPDSCAAIGKKDVCRQARHCTWAMHHPKQGRCFLQIPSASMVDLFVSKLTHELLSSRSLTYERLSNAAPELHKHERFFIMENTQQDSIDKVLSELKPTTHNSLYTQAHAKAQAPPHVVEIAPPPPPPVVKPKPKQSAVLKLLSDAHTEKLPSYHQKFMKHFEVAMWKHPYAPTSLYEFFVAAFAKAGKPPSVAGWMQSVRSAILEAYEDQVKPTLEALSFNTSFAHVMRALGLRAIASHDDLARVLKHEAYYPSDYELALLGNMVRLNVLVIGRKTQRTQGEYVRCIHAAASKRNAGYVLFRHTHDSTQHREVYEPVVKITDGNAVAAALFDAEEDFDTELRDILTRKCKATVTANAS